ncbi:MAG: hypothetical protein RIG62_10130 [Cyclobacteriaceae bacterium]
MMGRFNSIEKTLSTAQLILDGLLANPELIKVTTPYGYHKAHIRKEKAQLEHTLMLFNAKTDCIQEKKQATRRLNTARTELREVYLRHSGILRAFYRADTALLEELGLHRPTPKAWDRLQTQVQRFYAKAHTLREETTAFPLRADEMEQAQSMIGVIAEARVQQMRKKGEAERTTQLQNEALATLRQWVQDFLVIAKIAFRHDPQQLEALGIVVKAA